MYIIKVKGKAKIPDYVQIRDNNFSLIGYFRADRPEKGIENSGYASRIEEIKQLIDNLPFNKMCKIPEQ